MKLFFTLQTAILCAATLLSSTAFGQPGGDGRPSFVSGQLIIQTEKGVDPHAALAAYEPALGLVVKSRLSATMRAWLVEFDTLSLTLQDAINLLGRNAGLSHVQGNHNVWHRAIPNDPQFGNQWHHNNTGQSGGTVDADIDAVEAWNLTTGGTTATGDEIVVCIVEGVNMTHTDLIANRWLNTGEIAGNNIDDDQNGYIDDLYGWNVAGNNGTIATGAHGTNVAGMIGAKGNNGNGTAGVNWDVKIMVVSGENANNEASVIAAYDYALVQRQLYDQTDGAKGAFVVSTNASWGIDGGDPNDVPLWCAFYDTLGTYGIISCGATTNSNLNVDVSGDIPTACSSPYMVGVGRSDRNDNFAGGYGLTTIELASPGVSVTTADGTSGTTSTTGTSFASPLTAGAIALLYSVPCEGFAQTVRADPNLGADMVLDALLSGVDVKPSLVNSFVTGGRLNVNNSLNYILDNYCPTCLVPQQPTADAGSQGQTTLSWQPVTGAIGYTVSYRPVGAQNWITVQSSTPQVNIPGLDPCVAYEYQVQGDCGNEGLSTPSATVAFNPRNYCDNVGTSQVAGLNVYSPAQVAGSYTFQAPSAWGGNWQNGSVYGSLVLVNSTGANPTQGCTALTNGVEVAGNIALIDRGGCEFGVKALNAQNAGAAAVLIMNNAAGLIDMGVGAQGANVTIPVAMISQADGNTLKSVINNGGTITGLWGQRGEWVSSVNLGPLSHTSGNDNGYALHSLNQIPDLAAGSTLSMTIGTTALGGAALSQQVRAWMDADQDGVFESNELLMNANSTTGQNAQANVTVPANATLGLTRLRVQTTGQSNAPDVCGAYALGETEDFCINVTTAVGLSSTQKESWTLFPNPTSGLLQISGFSGTATYSIISADGREVMNGTLVGSSPSIDCTALVPGAYAISINASTDGRTFRFVRQ